MAKTKNARERIHQYEQILRIAVDRVKKLPPSERTPDAAAAAVLAVVFGVSTSPFQLRQRRAESVSSVVFGNDVIPLFPQGTKFRSVGKRREFSLDNGETWKRSQAGPVARKDKDGGPAWVSYDNGTVWGQLPE